VIVNFERVFHCQVLTTAAYWRIGVVFWGLFEKVKSFLQKYGFYRSMRSITLSNYSLKLHPKNFNLKFTKHS
jgi:hypothetical protein